MSESNQAEHFIDQCYIDQRKEISLHSQYVTEYDFQRLLGKVPTSEVCSINFSQTRFADQALFLFSKSCWDSLEFLSITNNHYDYNRVENFKLISSISAPRLTRVSFLSKHIDADKCADLVACNWPINRLNLSCNFIGIEESKVLAKAQWNLHQLSLRKNILCSEAFKHLTLGSWKELKILHLANNTIENLGCKYLMASGWSLRQVDLTQNEISASGCNWLSKSHWQEMLDFKISSNKIELGGLKLLIKSDMPKLTSIDCRNTFIALQNGVIGEEVKALMRLETAALKWIYLQGHNLQTRKEHAEWLKLRYPKCTVKQ